MLGVALLLWSSAFSEQAQAQAAKPKAKPGASPRPSGGPLPAPSSSPLAPRNIPPRVETLVKPAIYKAMLEDRRIDVDADLEGEKYSYHATMVVNAGVDFTRRILTDYQLYEKMIPYVEKTLFDSKTNTLQIEGGIWKFKLRSWVNFVEKSENWIHYRILRGHFEDLEGDIFFEPVGERGTAVYFRGNKIGSHWPPAFVIETGAEIVFGFTAKRMRSYVEEQKKAPQKHGPVSGPGAGPAQGHGRAQGPVQGENNSGELPQPRSRLE